MKTNEQLIIDRAFSKQSWNYDAVDRENSILQSWRKQIYSHVHEYLRPGVRLLELNAGTGIDASYFSDQGISVLATDLSDGMIARLQQKALKSKCPENFRVAQCAAENLDLIREKDFGYLFSNLGGLNCVEDLTKVTRHFALLLRPGAYVTLVIMPPVSFWECAWSLKGEFKKAFRRFRRRGSLAHVAGEYFKTYYHSLASIRKAMGSDFVLVRSTGLGALSPPPASAVFYHKYPGLCKYLSLLDKLLKNAYPFNRCADHLIVTFRRRSNSRLEIL